MKTWRGTIVRRKGHKGKQLVKIINLSLPGLTGQSREFNMTKTYYVYILSSKRNGTLYIGVTNNLERRLYEHKNNLIEGFTNKYNVHHLVYF